MLSNLGLFYFDESIMVMIFCCMLEHPDNDFKGAIKQGIGLKSLAVRGVSFFG